MNDANIDVPEAVPPRNARREFWMEAFVNVLAIFSGLAIAALAVGVVLVWWGW